MYPTISHLIKDLTSLNIPLPFATFGVFLVLSFFAGGFALKMELKRKENKKLKAPIANKYTSKMRHAYATCKKKIKFHVQKSLFEIAAAFNIDLLAIDEL